ncbi:MAG TPA: PglZ domain-containing protein, partial [Bacteroidia bacterium]|nr:PglZ domain-containing protein [Bacteroidia bacterium]
MAIAEYIQIKILEPRLREKQVLVLYDEDGRYRKIAVSMASDEIRFIDAGKSIVEAREAAMEALVDRGMQPENKPFVLVYVPTPPPADEENRCADFFSALAAAGDFFPNGDGDRYLNLCLGANPDHAGRIRELFAGGEPPFEAVDAIGDGGGRFPRLKTEFGCESNAEILITLMTPREEQEPALKRTGACRREALDFLQQVTGFQAKEATASWSIIRSELWRYILFSEFVFDLPEGPPDSLSKVPMAPRGTADLINRVCDSLRNAARTRPVYLEESERISAELGLEAEMARVRDLGVRDTFSFEERSFLAGYIDALREGDYAKAEAIASARKHSVWVQESDRQLLWTLAERALELQRGLDDFDRELGEVKPETPDLIAFYTGRGYRLDQRHRYFEETLAEIDEESEDIDRLVDECRTRYRNAVDRLQRLF